MLGFDGDSAAKISVSSLDKNGNAGVDSRQMELFSNKAIRLLLAVSVSIWMAGGCFFGCTNTTMGAAVTHDSHNIVEAVPSCHAKQSHDASNLKQQLADVLSFVPGPGGMMNECPLVVSSTAAISKNTTHMPDPARDAVAALPSFEKQTNYTENTLVVPFPPNRGPTHLRCCVFLI